VIGFEDPTAPSSDGRAKSAEAEVISLIVDSSASGDPIDKRKAIAEVAQIATNKASRLKDRNKQKEAL